MKERYEFLFMLLIACFVGSSFWPLVCGWVDISTLAGWRELIGGFISLAAVFAAFGLVGAITLSVFELLCLGCRGLSSAGFGLRDLIGYGRRLVLSVLSMALYVGWIVVKRRSASQV